MAAPDPANPFAPEGGPARAHVVLVVEDEILIRLAIADHLRDGGFKVYEAANGVEAVDLLSHCCAEIDAVFSDIMMPGMVDGLALVTWVERNCPGVPVILTSGAPDKHKTVADLKRAGLFFLKPYDMDAVASAIAAEATARARARDRGPR